MTACLLQAAVESAVSFSGFWGKCHAVEEHALRILFLLQLWFATETRVCLPLAVAFASSVTGVAGAASCGPELLLAHRTQPLSLACH